MAKYSTKIIGKTVKVYRGDDQHITITRTKEVGTSKECKEQAPSGKAASDSNTQETIIVAIGDHASITMKER